MTEQHRAKPEVWAAVERWCKNDMETLNCVLELRSRVEALEAAQQPTVEESLTVPADSLAGRQLWAAMSFRGVMLLPPIDCADPDFWIAERIYEMGLADGKNATTGTASVTRDCAEDAPESSDSLVELVADAIKQQMYRNLCDDSRAAILAVSDWLYQQGWRVAAKHLRQEAQ